METTLENKTVVTADGAIEITRIFDAPRGRVWTAWSDAENLQQWWGPKIFSCPYCRIDFRVGGTYHHCMRSPDCQEYWSTGTYKEIVPMERIVATDSFADEKGNVIPAAQIGMGDDWPLELLVTMTFEELDDKTRFVIRHVGVPEGQMREMCGQGWNESFDKMDDFLAMA